MASPVKALQPPTIQQQILQYYQLDQEIKALQKKRKTQGAKIIQSLGLGGMLQFQISQQKLRATVVQAHRRSIPWKELAYSLAKRLYVQNQLGLRRWLRNIAKKYPKKPSEPYVLITPAVKEEI